MCAVFRKHLRDLGIVHIFFEAAGRWQTSLTILAINLFCEAIIEALSFVYIFEAVGGNFEVTASQKDNYLFKCILCRRFQKSIQLQRISFAKLLTSVLSFGKRSS